MFKVKDLEAVEVYCEAIGNGEISFQVKTAVKANSVINSFSSDPEAIQLHSFMLITGPLQEFLNKVMKADGKVCELVTASTLFPDDPETLENNGRVLD